MVFIMVMVIIWVVMEQILRIGMIGEWLRLRSLGSRLLPLNWCDPISLQAHTRTTVHTSEKIVVQLGVYIFVTPSHCTHTLHLLCTKMRTTMKIVQQSDVYIYIFVIQS